MGNGEIMGYDANINHHQPSMSNLGLEILETDVPGNQ